MKGQGKDLRVLTLVQDRNPCVLVVPAASPVTKLADLKGKKIGVTATDRFPTWSRGPTSGRRACRKATSN
jgi:ABC-type nitrate/sulfonate/bicarbonate transport system substrate-binding protein